MGLAQHRQVSKATPLDASLLNQLVDATHFSAEEVEHIFAYFQELSQGAQTITKQHFQRTLGVKETLFFVRMFILFDRQGNQSIDFTNFVLGLSVLCTRASLDEKIQFSFRLYDFNNDGKISKEELCAVLESAMKENRLIYTNEQIMLIVKSTFQQADLNGDGFIDLTEYKRLVELQPSILENLTIDFKHIIHPNYM